MPKSGWPGWAIGPRTASGRDRQHPHSVDQESNAMAYSDFDLRTAVHTFGLAEERDTNLFADVEPLEPSEFLRAWLDEFAPVALGVNSEKARSEFIIAPILAETKRRAGTTVNVLPGVIFEVET